MLGAIRPTSNPELNDNHPMRGNWKPILALMLLSPLLTELLSGNIPLSLYLNPLMILLLATVGYGLPVLLLREFAVRRNMGLLGMLPLGLCYGIVNEGLLAKTFFLPHKVPNPSFDQYGFYGGVELPWAIHIASWHALFAFVFPILIVETFFPEHRAKPWLSGHQAIYVAVPLTALSILIFFTHAGSTSVDNPVHFAEITIAFLLLMLASTKMPQRPTWQEDSRFRLSKFFAGAGTLLGLLIVPSIFAGGKIPPIFFFLYYAVGYVLAFRFLSTHQVVSRTSALLFAIGAAGAQAAFGLCLAASKGMIQLAVTSTAFLVVFLIWTLRLQRRAAFVDETVLPSLG